uniref:Endonuclease/exonuclease/phosphatase domain-containing protein n=1 Tax=Octopus bimaculoides TaxID=37653 RepID=A0A0L8ICS8_OCTBM
MWLKRRDEERYGCFFSTYGLESGRIEEEVEEFWRELIECGDRVGKIGYVVLLGDLNARVENEEIENVVGKYGVFGRNESGRRLLEMCMEQELVKGTVVDRALMDYILIDKRVVGRLLDMHLMRGEGGGVSDHLLVQFKFMDLEKAYNRVDRDEM